MIHILEKPITHLVGEAGKMDLSALFTEHTLGGRHQDVKGTNPSLTNIQFNKLVFYCLSPCHSLRLSLRVKIWMTQCHPHPAPTHRHGGLVKVPFNRRDRNSIQMLLGQVYENMFLFD